MNLTCHTPASTGYGSDSLVTIKLESGDKLVANVIPVRFLTVYEVKQRTGS